MTLFLLSAEGKRLVTPDFAEGKPSEYSPSTYERYLDDCEFEISLDKFDEAVDAIIEETPRFDNSSDARAAIAIHKTLRLPRRVAAQEGVWRYLAVIRCPKMVRHRWPLEHWGTTRTKFWSFGTRPDSNHFCRLWWIAELTRDGESYELTKQVFKRQSLAKSLFVREFCNYHPAVDAFIDELHSLTPHQIEAVTKRFNGLLSTVVLEGTTREQLKTWLREIRESEDDL